MGETGQKEKKIKWHKKGKKAGWGQIALIAAFGRQMQAGFQDREQGKGV